MEVNKIYNENCLDTMQRMDNACIDLLLQDTPFGVTQNKWDIKPDLKIMWPEWLRITKPNAAMIFFATQPFASELILSNQKHFRYDLIWYKALGTGFLNANKMPLRNHENILIFYRELPVFNPQKGVGIRKWGMRKNDRNGTNYGKFATQGTSNYFDDKGLRFPQSIVDFSNGDRTTESDHPTQKPIYLIRYLIRTYSNENDLVFDGYMGSGTTAVACIIEKRNFIGSEISKEYCELAEKRLAPYLQQIQMF